MADLCTEVCHYRFVTVDVRLQDDVVTLTTYDKIHQEEPLFSKNGVEEVSDFVDYFAIQSNPDGKTVKKKSQWWDSLT